MNEHIKQAGLAILQDLALWNRSAVFFEQQIEQVAYRKCEDALTAWSKRNDWHRGGTAKTDLENIWLAPKHWNIGEDNWLACFWFCRRPDHTSNSYGVADLVEQGDTDFGFYFDVGYKHLGGKKQWMDYISRPSFHIDGLAKHGWSLKDGIFFLPAKLNVEMLISAWESGNWTHLTDPIGDHLDCIVEYLELFDAFLEGANTSK
ncbi:MAG: hypothetical protein ACFHHU_00550 [Porticoccaceae bacterium]